MISKLLVYIILKISMKLHLILEGLTMLIGQVLFIQRVQILIVMRVYGTWSTVHTETGAPVYNKWYGVINFNEDNKIATFSDWMDVNGMQVQIQQYLETSKN